MVDGERLFTAVCFDFLPGAQSIPADVLAALVSVFPESEREQAGKDLLEAVNMYLSHQRAQTAAREEAPDLHKVADALSAAADAIVELNEWSRWTGWNALPEVLAGNEADVPDNPEAWGWHMEKVQSNKFLIHRVWESRGDLWKLAGMLRTVKKPAHCLRKVALRSFIRTLRDVYNGHSGRKVVKNATAGMADARGQYEPSLLGKFIIAVLDSLGEERSLNSIQGYLRGC